MNAEELSEYMESNGISAAKLDILLFNNVNFSFMPILNPQLYIKDDNNIKSLSFLGAYELNLLSSDYQLPSFLITDEVIKLKNWNKMVNHPEHLSGYVCRYNEDTFGEIFYVRGNNGAELIRNGAFECFIDLLEIDSIEVLNMYIKKAEEVRNRYIKPKFRSKKTNTYYDVSQLIDESIVSFYENEGIKNEGIPLFLDYILYEHQEAYFRNKYVSVNNELTFHGQYNVPAIFFNATFVPVKEINTKIDKIVSIIDKNDAIPDILYKIAIEIKADVFKTATGYAFESGLNMLQPMLTCIKENGGKEIDIIVGDINKEIKSKKSVFNRSSAKKMNDLKTSQLINHIYTYPKSFYHGKFYYISNGSISYIIVGSSNITQSAYIKNREFDIIYRFESDEELYMQFMEWYEELKKDCVEIDRLDEKEFPRNLLYDEHGGSHGKGFVRELTSEEEKQRFKFLEAYEPDVVDEYLLSNRRKHQKFKGYIAFSYQEYGLTILECFSYGNSCYIFNNSNLNDIKDLIAFETKESVKNIDCFVADIKHDENYYSNLQELLNHYKYN